MYDNLKSEISELKLKATDKADYYRKALENERNSREQADKQVLELLHDVKNRYDTKLSSYMAKHRKSQTSAKFDDDWGSTNSKKVETDKSNSKSDQSKSQKVDQGWGSEQPKSNEVSSWDSPGVDDWGASNSKDDTPEKNKSNDDNGWGSGDPNSNQDNEVCDWGAESSPQNDNGWGNDCSKKSTPEKDNSNNDNGWGNEEPSSNQVNETSDWGAEATPQVVDDWNSGNNKEDNPEKSKTQGKKKKENKSPPKNTADSKGKDSSANKKANNNTKAKSGDNSSPQAKSSTEQESSRPPSSPKKKKDSKGDTSHNIEEPKADTSETRERGDIGNKEFLEVKSQLWTTKLDYRLAERDKHLLREEVDKLRQERDELTKKLAKSHQEQDALRMKVLKLTSDLTSMNDDFDKLNKRLDEVEAEKRCTERSLTLDESRRHAMESKTRAFQQQIADLQSVNTSLKEERDDFEKQCINLTRRNERLESDLSHSKKLIRTLKEGCAMVDEQAKNFEVRHDTVLMSKADMEREIIAIKEESSRHITTINKLQKANEQISKAFLMSVEAHDQCKGELEKLSKEYTRKLNSLELENHRVVEANNQLRKLIDFLQGKR